MRRSDLVVLAVAVGVASAAAWVFMVTTAMHIFTVEMGRAAQRVKEREEKIMLATDAPAPVGSAAWIAAHDAELFARVREAAGVEKQCLECGYYGCAICQPRFD